MATMDNMFQLMKDSTRTLKAKMVQEVLHTIMLPDLKVEMAAVEVVAELDRMDHNHQVVMAVILIHLHSLIPLLMVHQCTHILTKVLKS